MATKQPQQSQNFTPVFDQVRDECGISAALVFGAIWRFCQKFSACTASQETIGERCGMKRAAVNHQIAILVGSGYVKKTRKRDGAVLTVTDKLGEFQPSQNTQQPAEADPRQAPDVSDLDGEIRQMSDAFVKASGVQPFRMPEWIKALREMHCAGIRAETITVAVEKLRGKYTISGPWSIVKTAISIQASGNQTGKPAGNFGEIRE